MSVTHHLPFVSEPGIVYFTRCTVLNIFMYCRLFLNISDLEKITDLLTFIVFNFLSIFVIKIKKLSWKKYGLVLNTLTTTALPRNQPTDLPPPPYYTTTQTNRTAFFKSKVYRIPSTRFSDVYHSVYQYSDQRNCSF